ncbi:MAG: nucleotidyl transferase AbiEii/AbiGii toxin family protein [Acidobacteriota bacterium]
MLPYLKRLLGKKLQPLQNSSEQMAIESLNNINRPELFPNSYKAIASDDQQEERLKIFEPALKHFSYAFRLSDPQFQDYQIAYDWIITRRQVIDHLLKIIAGSIWKDHLVLRGSLLLKAWLGEQAREPGDIDWVFKPADIKLNDPMAKNLIDSLIQMVSDYPRAGKGVLITNKITMDDIWTYERAAGRRIIFPWRADGLPLGYVQIDLVFNEEIFTDPIEVTIPSPAGGGTTVWAASKELSLAWKILWLETDSYPQGKDLYDATLLAEQTFLPLDLLYQVLYSIEWHEQIEILPDFPLKWQVDWQNFTKEYPWIEGEANEWQIRLTRALTPTFATKG